MPVGQCVHYHISVVACKKGQFLFFSLNGSKVNKHEINNDLDYSCVAMQCPMLDTAMLDIFFSNFGYSPLLDNL